MANLIHINGADSLKQAREQAKNEGKVLLLDYWAEWCGPCKMIAPLLEEVSGENPEKVIIGKVDIEQAENQALSSEAGIRSIPTLTVEKDGETRGKHIGTLSKTDLLSLIDQAS